MGETFEQVGPTPRDEEKMEQVLYDRDEEKMEQVLYEAKEILANAVADEKDKKNFLESNAIPEDKERTESILSEVRNILACAAEDDEKRRNDQALEELNFLDDRYDDDFLEDVGISESELEEMSNMVETIEKELLDESSDFYTNVVKGSVDELFYETLAQEIPSLNLSLDDKAVDIFGWALENHIRVKTVPYNTNREFIRFLEEKNTVIKTLRSPGFSTEEDLEELHDLEEKGIIPKNFHRRAHAKEYEFYIKRWPDNADFWNKRIAKLGDITAFSDEEAREIMKKVILEEFKKTL